MQNGCLKKSILFAGSLGACQNFMVDESGFSSFKLHYTGYNTYFGNGIKVDTLAGNSFNCQPANAAQDTWAPWWLENTNFLSLVCTSEGRESFSIL